MTLPASGPISFNNINVELGVSGTTQASLGQTSYRNLAGVPSGAISMSNFYGKANQFAFSIASSVSQADLRTLALNAGWNGSSKVVATINSGVYVYSDSTGTAALTISGSFPNGVDLINNGVIIGRGGNGAKGNWSGYGGGGGGTALSVSTAVTISNNNIIGGGGGGGGGGAGYIDARRGAQVTSFTGGGGGGGIGNGLGGPPGTGISNYGQAGSNASLTSAGTGGQSLSYSYMVTTIGGNGGSYGSSGGAGQVSSTRGPYYGNSTTQPAGGGGACTSGNSFITWAVVGNRYGALN